MKTYVHYTLWNKDSHIDWIMRGINYFIPKNSYINFILDNPINDLQENLIKEYAPKYLSDYNFKYSISEKKYRFQNTNDAILDFLKTDCELFVSPQDDQKIQDSQLLNNLINLYAKEGIGNVGLIGMRDGFDLGCTYKYSSNQSIISGTTTWLKNGEYKSVQIINDGPIALHRKTISDVGLFDCENFNVFYIEYDYCFRCIKQNKNNYVLGAEIVHEKFGNIIASEVYGKKYGIDDERNLRLKHKDIL